MIKKSPENITKLRTRSKKKKKNTIKPSLLDMNVKKAKPRLTSDQIFGKSGIEGFKEEQNMLNI